MRSVPVRFALPLLALACSVASTVQAGGKTPEEPPLPAPRVILSFSTPTATGPWVMTLRNADAVPIRVVADARRLRLLLRLADHTGYAECALPADMRGSAEPRRLVLQPGDEYEEPFEPGLFCWNKLHELLAPGASVTAFLGWEPDKRLERMHKPQRAPFEVEPAQAPASVRSEKQLASLTTWLPAPRGEGSPKPHDETKPHDAAKPHDETKPIGQAHLELSASQFEDADSFRSARVRASVKNTGDRSGTIHLRADSLELRVSGPYGQTAVCAPPPGRRAVARDFFQTIAPGKSSSVEVLVNEVCPRGTFDRPGLYILNLVLHATERGDEFGLDAVTGRFAAPDPVLLRIRQAPQPYHNQPPHARPPKHR